MAMPGFIFGGSEPLTYEQLQRKREIADALMAQNLRAPQTFGEGLTAVGRAIAAKKMNKKLDARDAELRAEFNDRFAGAFSGGGGYGLGGSYGGYTPPPPKSQWNAGTTETPEQKAAREANSRTTWNGGEISDMQPNMFSTFGQDMPGMGKSGYDMGTDVAASYGHPVADEFAATLAAGGLPQHAIDGIMMNAKDESAFNPTAIGDNGNAFGLLQWNGPRMRAFKEWSASQGLDPASPSTQAKFTLYELQGPEAGAGRALLSTSTPGEAGAVFVNQYERPAEQHRASREAAYLSGGGITGSGGGSPGMAPFNPSMFGQIDEGQTPQQPGLTGYGMGFTPQGGMTGGSMDLGTLAALAASPYASPEQKAIVNALMTQQMNAMDPMYQLQLQQEQLKLAQMQGGGAVDPTKNAPNGYMWTDPNDPSKGVTLIPGYTPSGGQDININTAEGGLPGLGKLDPGYTYLYDEAGNVKRDADGMPMVRAIPGSKAEQEQKAAEAEAAAAADKAAKANENTTQTAGVVLGKLDQLDALVDQSSLFNPTTGFGAETAAGIGGTNAANAKAVIDTIKANMGFETLAAMRAASPTGGALGAISDSEMTLLTSTLASLAQTQDPAQMKRHIQELRQIYSDIMAKAAVYPNAAQFGYGGGGAGVQEVPQGLTEDDMKWLQ